MKKLLVAGAVLVISAAANAAPGLSDLSFSLLPDMPLFSVKGGHGHEGRREFDDEHDRGRHRGEYKRKKDRREVREAPGPSLPAPSLPRLPAPPLPPGLPRPPGL